MIAPHVVIEDLDAEGFAHLCSLLARRQMVRPPELQVLHDSGRVLRVVHSVRGVLDRHRESFSDPQTRAEELLGAGDVHRVVLIDRGGLRDLWERIDSFGSPDNTQAELLWSANEAFWSHPCVVTAPDPALPVWPALARRVEKLADFEAVLGVWRGEELFLSLVATFEAGRMTRLTSIQGARPARDAAARLMDSYPDAAVLLLCELPDLEQALAAPDAQSGLMGLLDEARCIAHRGMREVLCEPSG